MGLTGAKLENPKNRDDDGGGGASDQNLLLLERTLGVTESERHNKQIVENIISNFGYEDTSLCVQWREVEPAGGELQRKECIIKSEEKIPPKVVIDDQNNPSDVWKIEKVTTATLFSVARVKKRSKSHDSILFYDYPRTSPKNKPALKSWRDYSDGSQAVRQDFLSKKNGDKLQSSLDGKEEGKKKHVQYELGNSALNDLPFAVNKCGERRDSVKVRNSIRMNEESSKGCMKSPLSVLPPPKREGSNTTRVTSNLSDFNTILGVDEETRSEKPTNTEVTRGIKEEDLEILAEPKTFVTPKSSLIVANLDIKKFKSCLFIERSDQLEDEDEVQDKDAKALLMSYAINYTEVNTKDGSFHKLPRAFDPNLGLMGFQPELTNNLRTTLCMEWSKNPSRLMHNVPRVAGPWCGEGTALLVGGLNPLDSKDYWLSGSMMQYQPSRNIWEHVGFIPEPRCYHTCVFMNHKLYLIGGYCPFLRKRGESLATPTTYCYDINAHIWFRLQDLNHARACHDTAVVGGHIYVVGGRDTSGRILSSMEVLVGRSWLLKSNLPCPVLGCSVAAGEGKFWVVGGLTSYGSGMKFLDAVYSLSLEDNHWSQVTTLPEFPRAFSKAVWHQEKLWVCGGCTGSNPATRSVSLARIDVYSPSRRSWDVTLKLSVPRHAMGLCPIGDSLLVTGGVNSHALAATSTSEFLNRPEDSTKVSPLPAPVAGASLLFIP